MTNYSRSLKREELAGVLSEEVLTDAWSCVGKKLEPDVEGNLLGVNSFAIYLSNVDILNRIALWSGLMGGTNAEIKAFMGIRGFNNDAAGDVIDLIDSTLMKEIDKSGRG